MGRRLAIGDIIVAEDGNLFRLDQKYIQQDVGEGVTTYFVLQDLSKPNIFRRLDWWQLMELFT